MNQKLPISFQNYSYQITTPNCNEVSNEDNDKENNNRKDNNDKDNKNEDNNNEDNDK